MKERRKLVKVATDLIVKLGAVPATFYQYQMETSVGKLHITIDNDDHRNGMLVIFCRFEEPKRALAICPYANPYTGKNNFHFAKDDSYESALQAFTWMMTRICPTVPPDSLPVASVVPQGI